MQDLINIFKESKRHVMSAVGYIIPAVAAGGLIIGIAIILGGNAGLPDQDTFAWWLFLLGKYGMNAMGPLGGAYVAFSIADRNALVPGLILGMLSLDMGIGFIGGIVGGFLAGIIVTYLKKIKVSKNLRTMKDIILIPTVTIMVGGIILNYVLGSLITGFTNWLTTVIGGMTGSSLIFIAMLSAAINQLDYGVFLSKATTVISTTMISQVDPATGLPPANGMIMLAAGCMAQAIPPLVCFISTLISKRKKYTDEDMEMGRTALILSFCGITEGAIPFALKDYVKTTLCCCLGAAVASGLTVLFNLQTLVLWSGPISFLGYGSIGKIILGFVAMFVGGIVGGVVLSMIKKPLSEQPETVDEDKEAKTVGEGEEVTLKF